jgi:hypothetical protein
MSKKSVTEVVSTIVDELTPLSSEERQRVVEASLTLLGESKRRSVEESDEKELPDRASGEQLPQPARIWMHQNSLTHDDLQQVFHISDEGVEVIASEAPGRGRSEQVRNVYLLIGASRLLASGDPSFDDKAARALCESLGCYDSTNHSKYMKDKGNEFVGTKSGGWTLTGPGKKRAAALVKEMGQRSHD